MQMKEICERTGLTDRAVRLYIENGLLSPAIESNYAGRRSIRFSEEDAEILGAIAALRRAEFSLSDIRRMQMEPAQIPDVIAAHRRRLQEDVEQKQHTLQVLEEMDAGVLRQYTDVASFLSAADAPDSISTVPKEDSFMRLKDLQFLIRRRIPSVIGFAILLLGAVLLIPLVIKTAFAEVEIQSGGGYQLRYYVFDDVAGVKYSIGGDDPQGNLLLFLFPLGLLTGAVLLFLHVFSGKRSLVLAGAVVCAACLLGFLFLPDVIRQALYRYEFLQYRESFMWAILSGTTRSMDMLIASLKLIPPVGGLICCTCSLAQRKTAAGL